MVDYIFYDRLFDSASLPVELRDRNNQNRLVMAIESKLQHSEYHKGQLLLNNGQIPDHIYFIKTGLVRAYTLDQNSSEHTLQLWSENSLCTDSSAFFTRSPSKINLEAFAGTELSFLSHKHYEEIQAEFPYTKVYNDMILAEYVNRLLNYLIDAVTLTPKERYNKLLTEIKGLHNLVGKKVVASYLNVSRQYLDRL